MAEVKLTRLGSGGGCGCKMDAQLLAGLIGSQPPADSRLLVGSDGRDDACAWQLASGDCLVASADFFTPIVDDPHDFGAIAATNALSDIYAMGARPHFALALVGMPVAEIGTEVIGQILAGGQAAASAAGVPIAGGHSIDSPEPIYGLAVVGGCRREHLLRNCTAKRDDALILAKPLGIGVLAAGLQKGKLSAAGYARLRAVATQLNAVGAELAEQGLVNALTDVTGFGLLGHLDEMCAGSRLGARIDLAALPLLPQARQLAESGVAPGAAGRNWRNCQDRVAIDGKLADWQRILLCDPQTSGGLLAACAPERSGQLLAHLDQAGFQDAAVIGQFTAGGEVPITIAG